MKIKKFIKDSRIHFKSFCYAKKVYTFCISVIGGVHYVHIKHPKIFEFTNKELLFIVLFSILTMFIRSALAKIHGEELDKYEER